MTWLERDLHCDRSRDGAAYALRALEDREAESLRSHLEDCAHCRAELAEVRPVVDLLAASSPAVAAPGSLRDRVLAVVHSEAELLNAAGQSADRSPTRTVRWRLRPVAAMAAAAAMGVGVVVGVALQTDSGSTALHQTRAAVASSRGRAVLRQAAGRSELSVSELAPPPAGRIYQVWLQRAGRSAHATDALFTVDNTGHATVDVPGSLRGVQQVIVTAEPMGGSPTGVPSGEALISVHPAAG